MAMSNENPVNQRALSDENRALFASGRRRCSACRRVKSLKKSFSPNGRGFQSICKACRAKKRRDKWANDPKSAREQQQDNRTCKEEEARNKSIPLLAVSRLPSDVLDGELDEIIAKVGNHPKRVNFAW